MKYQAHIDGLRAVAVLGVILFHLDLHWFKGGFVGVDVFFVISGFLITSVIVKEIQSTGDFSFKNFYTRRARRLLPALFSVFAICLVVALFLYSSERLYDFGKELIFSVASLANFLFWFESGYFDDGADTKLLLHMWSLSVEEQFYLFWPLLLTVIYKRCSRKTIFMLGVGGFLVGLIVNIVLTNIEIDLLKNQSEMVFYLMPFRVYELLIGACGVWAFYKVPNNSLFRELIFWLGAAAIGFSIFFYSSSMKFPYYSAVLPCLGALCMILSKGSYSGKLLLENRPLVTIGLLSYTLYLVHWPVIVFYKYFLLVELTSIDKIIAILITLALTLLIYLGVEKPMRKPKSIETCGEHKGSNVVFLKGCAAAAFLFFAIGSVFATTSGLSGFKNELISEDEVMEGKQHRYVLTKQGCLLIELDSKKCKNDRPLQVMILGNSHEPDGYNIFHTMFGAEPSVNLIRFGGTNYCEVNRIDNKTLFSPIKKRKCNEKVAKLNDLDFVRSLDVVVFSSNRPFAPNKLSSWKMLEHIFKVNKSIEILVLGTYLNTEIPCSEIVNRFNDFEQCMNPKYISYIGNSELGDIHNPEVVKRVEFTYLDKFAALCNTEKLESCPVSANGEPMFYDRTHLSLGFARLVATKFLEVYGDELREAGFPVDSVL